MMRMSGLTLAAGLLLAGCGGSDDAATTTTTTTTTTTASTAPGAPTIGAATAGNASASIAFTAPASNGGSAITGYTASCAGGGATITGTGTASPITVSGLANGTAYSCSVTATNAVGTSAASGTVSVTPSAGAQSTSNSTASVLCPFSQSTLNTTLNLTSTSSWTCSSTIRTLTANGLPDHTIGTFPNANNPTAVSAQTVSFRATLTPTAASTNNTNRMQIAYALNGVKFDPATAGTCPNDAASVNNCSLNGNVGTWSIEALGQTSFNFGVDTNNAHVQPTGAYHYHGVPTGILTKAGVSDASRRMVLAGWAPDGYPVYLRYGYTTAANAQSALKVITGSYQLKTTPDSGRPSTTVIPMGAFTQDYTYVAGSGDLDECNGRTGVTPEFPNGIYHYYVTDTYPFFSRCWKGVI